MIHESCVKYVLSRKNGLYNQIINSLEQLSSLVLSNTKVKKIL